MIVGAYHRHIIKHRSPSLISMRNNSTNYQPFSITMSNHNNCWSSQINIANHFKPFLTIDYWQSFTLNSDRCWLWLGELVTQTETTNDLKAVWTWIIIYHQKLSLLPFSSKVNIANDRQFINCRYSHYEWFINHDSFLPSSTTQRWWLDNHYLSSSITNITKHSS